MENIKTCKHCNTNIEYEGYDDNNGHIWSCENCDGWVCSLCIEKAGSSVYEDVEKILCPTCLN